MGLNAAETKAVARDDGPMILSSAPEGYDALVMADIARTRGGLSLFIARDGGRAQTFIDALRFFAPEVECIGKGKPHKPYEFGVKASIAVTHKQGLIVGARTFPGNPYDGHTLHEQIELVLELWDVLLRRLVALRRTTETKAAHLVQIPCGQLTVTEGDFTADEGSRNSDLIGTERDRASG